jgi:hypothetical protein
MKFHLHGGRVAGDREVSRPAIREVSHAMSTKYAEAYLEEEGGPWGKHGFPRGSEAQPSDVEVE